MLKRIRNPHDAISEEIEEMRVSANRNTTTSTATTFRQIWRHKQVRKALIVGSALQLFQQLSGINTVMYYSASIVQMAGFADTSKSIWLASTTAAVNFGCTFIGCIMIMFKEGMYINMSVIIFLNVVSFSVTDTNTDIDPSNCYGENFVPNHPSPKSPLDFGQAFCSIMFSYSGASTFPTIQADMKERSKFPISATLAIGSKI